jgi:hypothetical protein
MDNPIESLDIHDRFITANDGIRRAAEFVKRSSSAVDRRAIRCAHARSGNRQAAGLPACRCTGRLPFKAEAEQFGVKGPAGDPEIGSRQVRGCEDFQDRRLVVV